MTKLGFIQDAESTVKTVCSAADMLDKYNIRPVKPMIAADLEFQRFWLASHLSSSSGLYVVTYYVIEKNTGAPFGIGSTKGEAIRTFRTFLKCAGTDFDELCLMVIAERERRKQQREFLSAAAQTNVVEIRRERVEPNIPRRRRQIFEKSGGKCHYCSTPLELTGEWHVDHMMPKALGGSNDPVNLVASCPPCNHQKRDTTDQEFIAKRAKQAAQS